MDVGSLCDFCYHFWTDDREELLIFAHGLERDMGAMRDSAKAGCHCCAIFLANVVLNEPHKETIELGSNNRVFVMFHENLLALLSLLGDRTARTRLRFILRHANKEFNEMLEKREHAPWTGSPSSFAQAKQWLRHCEESHSACRSPDPAYRPSRLLYIDSEKQTASLRSCGSIPDKASYATLSHCWGGAIADTLKRDNFTTFQYGIPVAQLAKTFQEAIKVCQEFQLEYIWIDCFCIIQDDPEDWRRESIKMQKIYGNAYLTIAATDAKDSHAGLFRERDAKALQPFKLSLEDMMPARELLEEKARAKFLKEYEDLTSNPGAILYLTDIDLAWERFEEAPLNRRSWTLQERILSPRVLHYDKDQLVWECDSLTACERFSGPIGIGGLIPAKKRVRASVDKLHCMQVTDRPLGQELHDSWIPIIKAYTSAGLTKQTDRLIALEGIAQWLAQTYTCSYVAGLFTRNMESQLAWKLGGERQKSGTESRIPDVMIAPSWSWASFLGEIDMLPQWQAVDSEEPYRALESQDLCEIILCQVTNKDTLAATWTLMDVPDEMPLEIRCFLAQVRLLDFSEIKAWPDGKHKMSVWREGESPMSSPDCLPYDEQRPWDDLWPLAFGGGGGDSTNYRIHNGNPAARLMVETLTKQQADSFRVGVDLDYWENYRKHRAFLLMPTYEVTRYERQNVVEKANVRIIQGLVLDRLGTSSNRFRRTGTFTVEWDYRNEFWRAAVGTDVPGLPKHKTDVNTWPNVDCVVSSGKQFQYEKRGEAPQYQIVVL